MIGARRGRMTDQWSYECEDELEANGMALLLERQSIRVVRTPGPNRRVVLSCEGRDAGLAREFESRVLARNAEQLRREDEADWAARDGRRDRRLTALAGLGLLSVVVMILRTCS